MAFDTLRRPLFLIGIVLFVLALLVELGSKLATMFVKTDTFGIAIHYLALLDWLIILALTVLALSLLLTDWVLGPGRVIANLVVSIIVLIVSVIAAFAAFALLMTQLTLLLAPIFGTIAYFALYVPFPVGAATATLSVLMLLKLGGCICLVLSQPRFLESKGLVLILLCAIGCLMLIGFLYSLVPGILIPIVDSAAGLVIAIVAIVWAVIYLIGAIIGLVKVIV